MTNITPIRESLDITDTPFEDVRQYVKDNGWTGFRPIAKMVKGKLKQVVIVRTR